MRRLIARLKRLVRSGSGFYLVGVQPGADEDQFDALSMEKNMKTLSLIIAAISLTAGLTNARELDAPGGKQITVRSEIERGIGAMNRSMLPADMQRQYEAIMAINRQRNTDSDGFRLGLNYIAWHRGWMAANIPMRGWDQKFAEAQATQCYRDYKTLRTKLEISAAQMKELAGIWYRANQESAFEDVLRSRRFAGSYRATETN